MCAENWYFGAVECYPCVAPDYFLVAKKQGRMGRRMIA
jgi:hypothetical protein